MKKTVVFYFIILSLVITGELVAQTAQDTTARRSKVDSILNEKYYTRIPNKDFDEIIQSKISKEVDSKFNFWLLVIGGFIGAIATIGGYAFNNMIKHNVSEELKNQSNKYIQDYKLFEYDGRLKIITKEFDEFWAARRSAEYNRSILECEDLLLEIKSLNINDVKINKVLAKAIDQLTYMYYITLLVDLPKMEKLIKDHELVTDIPVTAYTNLAILYSELFALLGDESYKIHGIQYCERASTKSPIYGESRGIHILIYAIDFFLHRREDAKENARKILQKVLKVDSLAFDTLSRLKVDKARKYTQEIEELERALPEEFRQLSQKSATFALRDKMKSPVPSAV